MILYHYLLLNCKSKKVGKVYSWSDVETFNIPTPSSTVLAKKIVLDMMEKLVSEGRVLGGKIYGSYSWGTQTIRSDLDTLVIYDDFSVLRVLREIRLLTHSLTKVDFEPVAIHVELAKKGMSTVDGSFLGHLKRSPVEGNSFGLDPLDLLKSKEGKLASFNADVVRHKIRFMSDAIINPYDKLYSFQRFLELPMAIARRYIDTWSTFNQAFSEFKDDSKQPVFETFCKLFPKQTSIGSNMRNIYMLDKNYSVFLHESLEGRHSREEYDDYLADIEKKMPSGLYWLKEISDEFGIFLERENRYGTIEGRPSINKEVF